MMVTKSSESKAIFEESDAAKGTARSGGGSLLAGLLLIGAGVLALAMNLLEWQIQGEVWPLAIMLPGILMLMPALEGDAEASGGRTATLAAAGAVVIMLGLLTAFAESVDHYESWAYAWTLLPAAAAAGRMFAHRAAPASPVHRSGRRTIRLMLILFVGLAVFFEMFIFNGYGRWWPILLIAAGLTFLLSSRR